MTVRVPLRKAPFVAKATSAALAPPEMVFGENGRPRREDVQILLAEGEFFRLPQRFLVMQLTLSAFADNELIRDIVTRLLKKMRFSVDSVADGAAAVKAVGSKRYDVM